MNLGHEIRTIQLEGSKLSVLAKIVNHAMSMPDKATKVKTSLIRMMFKNQKR